MTQQEPQRYPVIVDELQNQARILNAAAATRDGRSADAKRQRKMADLLLRAALHIVRLTKKPTPALPAETPAVESPVCEGCGHLWKYHTVGGLCQGTAEGIECHCVLQEKEPHVEGLLDQPPIVHGGDRDV